jgi:hypothetical protein
MKLTPFQITRYLFIFTFAVLVVFGVGSLLQIFTNPDRAVLYVFYAVVMFGDAVLMGFCAWQLPKRTKFIFYFSIFVLALNIIPTIFDQFGLADLSFVLLNIATLISLFEARKEFLPA